MSQQSDASSEARIQPRLRVPAMYTLLRARLAGDDRYRWTGHIYDISVSGIRFELDEPLEPGTRVEVRGMLPGHTQTFFRALGPIVRIHDDVADDFGPTRMAMRFEQFHAAGDRRRLHDYVLNASVQCQAA